MKHFVIIGAVLWVAGCGGSELDTGSSPDAGGALEAASSQDATSGASTDTGSVAMPCVPGQSVACVGPGGCSSNQVCDAEGRAFGPCNCGQPLEASTLEEASTFPDTGTIPLCVPGQSISCTGPGGCLSDQVCNAAGTGYSGCTCSDNDGATLVCIPGKSIACTGQGGCFANQVCNGEGTAFGPCVCSDAGSVECETANDCTNLLGPPPGICVMCPNSTIGCAYYVCVSGICQTSYCG